MYLKQDYKFLCYIKPLNFRKSMFALFYGVVFDFWHILLNRLSELNFAGEAAFVLRFMSGNLLIL